MDEQQPSSSWDDLLRQVGAEPPADALERKRPAIETRFEPPADAPPPSKPKAGDWNALASQLGVEPAPPSEPEPPKPSRPKDRPPARRHAPTAGDLESSFAGIAPIEAEFEQVVEAEISDVEFTDATDSDLEDDADQEFAGESEDDPDALSGEAARSAFEALFQAGSFSAMSAPESPTAREPKSPRARRDSSRERDVPKDRWGRPLREPQSRYAEEGVDQGSDKGSSGEKDDAETTDDLRTEQGDRPGRRRRRRGRGRGRDRESTPTPEGRRAPAPDDDDWIEPLEAGEEENLQTEDDEAREPEGDRPQRRRRGRRRGRSVARGEGDSAATSSSSASRNGRRASSRTEDEDDGLEPASAEGSDDEGEDDENAGTRSSHKNIPTWSDAISVMIETNLAARKNSPQRPGGRERNARGGRGRGRGGRGRGGG